MLIFVKKKIKFGFRMILSALKMLLLIYLIFGGLTLTKSELRRCGHMEVFSNQWCYRLTRLNETLKCSNFNCLIEGLTRLYTLGAKLDERYELANVRNEFDIWNKLISVAEMLEPAKVEIRIMMNQFKLNESLFVEGLLVDTEHPNLMIHEENLGNKLVKYFKENSI